MISRVARQRQCGVLVCAPCGHLTLGSLDADNHIISSRIGSEEPVQVHMQALRNPLHQDQCLSGLPAQEENGW